MRESKIIDGLRRLADQVHASVCDLHGSVHLSLQEPRALQCPQLS